MAERVVTWELAATERLSNAHDLGTSQDKKLCQIPKSCVCIMHFACSG